MEAKSRLRQGVVLFAKDKDRVSPFYQRALGLAVEESADSHDLLVGPGQEIVVHSIPPQYAQGISISDPPVLRESTPVKPAFLVEDLDVVRRAAGDCGGGLRPDSEAWHYRGYRVLDGWDPEGNIVQFRQWAPDRE